MKIIIIGAGAAGLMAAYELTKNNKSVLLLERENRIGGRINTLIPNGFSQSIEAGAEFIHGELPLTLSMLNKARLSVSKVCGEFYKFSNNRLTSGFGEGNGWEEFYQKALKLKNDCTLSEFLNKNFSAKKFDKLRAEASDMAQGLDLANPDGLSVYSIRKEWISEEQQYRPRSGYSSLLQYLHDQSSKQNYELKLNQIVSHVDWKKNAVTVYTSDQSFDADAVIVTASVGNINKQQLKFQPEIDEKLQLFNQIGFGSVIKIILEFKHAFWEEKTKDLGFLFTPQAITFWTQLEETKPFLMGWIGNSHVSDYNAKTDAEIIDAALEALVAIFGNDVRKQFKNGEVYTYDKDSASSGGYSYLKVGSKKAISELNKGIDKTIWFAGEALHPKGEIATVEAALKSGRFVARKIINK